MALVINYFPVFPFKYMRSQLAGGVRLHTWERGKLEMQLLYDVLSQQGPDLLLHYLICREKHRHRWTPMTHQIKLCPHCPSIQQLKTPTRKLHYGSLLFFCTELVQFEKVLFSHIFTWWSGSARVCVWCVCYKRSHTPKPTSPEELLLHHTTCRKPKLI